MFLQYAGPGAWWPVFSLRLHELNFGPVEMACGFASSAIGAIVASLIAGQVADRWLPAEKCIAGCAAAAGLLLFTLAEATTPAAVCLLCIASWLMIIPTLTLGLTLSMAHLRRPERQFAGVRLWGTVGWAGAGWLVGYWFAEPDWLLGLAHDWLGRECHSVADSQRLAAILAFVLAVYALTLPHTPPARRASSWLAPLEAVHLLRGRSFAILCFCAVCVHMTLPFSQQQTPLLLQELGVPHGWIFPALTIAQSMEVLSLGMLPWLERSFGLRNTLLFGLATWAAALAILTTGEPTWLVIASQTLNGFCITCYLVRAQVYVNQHAASDIRASAQGLFVLLNGVGLLAGNLLVGYVRRIFAGQFAPTFAIGLSITLAAVVVFLLGFEKKPQTARRMSEKKISPFTKHAAPPASVHSSSAAIAYAAETQA
jgi:MFS family permease